MPAYLAAGTQTSLNVCKRMAFCSCSLHTVVKQLFSHLCLALERAPKDAQAALVQTSTFMA